jgi:N-acyl-D-aspartate/D-glutamate deacylase
MSILIQGGAVYDGSGAPPIEADVLIEGERIAAIGARLAVPPDAEVIDAHARVVCPGFIDTHRHADVAAFVARDFGQTELAQGVTTTVVGNCGMSPVPAVGPALDEYQRYVEPVVGQIPSGRFFTDYETYTAALKQLSLPLNMGFLAGAGAIKTAVKGFAKTAFTADEMKRATAYIGQAMECGALGLSFGVMYQPECYSTREELTTLARAAAGRTLCAHIRGEGDSLVASVREVIDVARDARLPLNISHFKATGIANWRDAIFRAIESIEAARNAGQLVTADFYPYDGGSTTILSLIPPCVLEDSASALVRKLQTPVGKEQLRDEIRKTHAGWDNMAASIGWERVIISSVMSAEHAKFCGKSMAAITSEYGYEEPVDLLRELVISEEGRVGIIVLSMAQDDIDAVVRLPWTALISDALYGNAVNPHPRLNGAFPRLLRDYTRERRLLAFEEAIHKMTLMGAERFNIRERGALRAGYYADALIFAAERFIDHADYQRPTLQATGMETIILNGKIVRRRESNRAKAGKALFA